METVKKIIVYILKLKNSSSKFIVRSFVSVKDNITTEMTTLEAKSKFFIVLSCSKDVKNNCQVFADKFMFCYLDIFDPLR